MKTKKLIPRSAAPVKREKMATASTAADAKAMIAPLVCEVLCAALGNGSCCSECRNSPIIPHQFAGDWAQ